MGSVTHKGLVSHKESGSVVMLLCPGRKAYRQDLAQSKMCSRETHKAWLLSSPKALVQKEKSKDL